MAESSGGGIVLLGLFGLALYSCASDDEASSSEYAYSEDYGTGTLSRPAFDEDAARDAATDEVASQSYTSTGSPYGCTADCSGHDAGFAWAADGNEDYGTSSSQSFDEGQRAFSEAVEDRVDEMRDEYEAGEEPY